MDAQLQDKVVLITGAARRVGATIARKLHAAGAQVVLHYHRSANEAQALAAELNAERPSSVRPLGGHGQEVKGLEALLWGTIARHGHLDILINNASIFDATPVGTIPPAQWDALMGTNLRVRLFLSQAAAPHL